MSEPLFFLDSRGDRTPSPPAGDAALDVSMEELPPLERHSITSDSYTKIEDTPTHAKESTPKQMPTSVHATGIASTPVSSSSTTSITHIRPAVTGNALARAHLQHRPVTLQPIDPYLTLSSGAIAAHLRQFPYQPQMLRAPTTTSTVATASTAATPTTTVVPIPNVPARTPASSANGTSNAKLNAASSPALTSAKSTPSNANNSTITNNKRTPISVPVPTPSKTADNMTPLPPPADVPASTAPASTPASIFSSSSASTSASSQAPPTVSASAPSATPVNQSTPTPNKSPAMAPTPAIDMNKQRSSPAPSTAATSTPAAVATPSAPPRTSSPSPTSSLEQSKASSKKSAVKKGVPLHPTQLKTTYRQLPQLVPPTIMNPLGLPQPDDNLIRLPDEVWIEVMARWLRTCYEVKRNHRMTFEKLMKTLRSDTLEWNVHAYPSPKQMQHLFCCAFDQAFTRAFRIRQQFHEKSSISLRRRLDIPSTPLTVDFASHAELVAHQSRIESRKKKKDQTDRMKAQTLAEEASQESQAIFGDMTIYSTTTPAASTEASTASATPQPSSAPTSASTSSISTHPTDGSSAASEPPHKKRRTGDATTWSEPSAAAPVASSSSSVVPPSPVASAISSTADSNDSSSASLNLIAEIKRLEARRSNKKQAILRMQSEICILQANVLKKESKLGELDERIDGLKKQLQQEQEEKSKPTAELSLPTSSSISSPAGDRTRRLVVIEEGERSRGDDEEAVSEAARQAKRDARREKKAAKRAALAAAAEAKAQEDATIKEDTQATLPTTAVEPSNFIVTVQQDATSQNAERRVEVNSPVKALTSSSSSSSPSLMQDMMEDITSGPTPSLKITFTAPSPQSSASSVPSSSPSPSSSPPLPLEPYTLRAGQPSDAAALSDFARSSFLNQFANDNTPDDMMQYCRESFSPEIQHGELTNPNLQVFILERASDRTILGYAMTRLGSSEPCLTSTNCIELQRIYVEPGKGYGTLLMRRCLQHALWLGRDYIWLGVWEHNPRAIKLYQRFGFVQCGTHEFLLGSDRQTDLVMERHIDPSDANMAELPPLSNYRVPVADLNGTPCKDIYTNILHALRFAPEYDLEKARGLSALQLAVLVRQPLDAVKVILGEMLSAKIVISSDSLHFQAAPL